MAEGYRKLSCALWLFSALATRTDRVTASLSFNQLFMIHKKETLMVRWIGNTDTRRRTRLHLRDFTRFLYLNGPKHSWITKCTEYITHDFSERIYRLRIGLHYGANFAIKTTAPFIGIYTGVHIGPIDLCTFSTRYVNVTRHRVKNTTKYNNMDILPGNTNILWSDNSLHYW